MQFCTSEGATLLLSNPKAGVLAPECVNGDRKTASFEAAITTVRPLAGHVAKAAPPFLSSKKRWCFEIDAMPRKKQELGAPSPPSLMATRRPIDVNGVQESSAEQHQSRAGGSRVGRGNRHCFSVLLFPSWPSLSPLFAIAVCGHWNFGMQRG